MVNSPENRTILPKWVPLTTQRMLLFIECREFVLTKIVFSLCSSFRGHPERLFKFYWEGAKKFDKKHKNYSLFRVSLLPRFMFYDKNRKSILIAPNWISCHYQNDLLPESILNSAYSTSLCAKSVEHKDVCLPTCYRLLFLFTFGLGEHVSSYP